MLMDKLEIMTELIFRSILLIYYLITCYVKPRVREIHDEEWWLYMNPTGNNYIPFRWLIVLVMLNAMIFPIIVLLTSRKKNTIIISALLGYSLSVLLNTTITNTLKVLVGRPRPDFYFRCFTEGKKFSSCNGADDDINEGLKSFPSGHSSMSMAAFAYTSLFLIGQMRLFAKQKGFVESMENDSTKLKFLDSGRFLGCKLIICLIPVFVSILVCVSRLIDFHHHFDDIAVGAFIGLTVAFISYRLYFPSIFNNKSNCPRFHYEIVKNRKNSSKLEGDFTV